MFEMLYDHDSSFCVIVKELTQRLQAKSEAAIEGVLWKKLFLTIPQN